MQKTAAEEIMRQHPALRGFSKIEPPIEDNIDRFLTAASITLGHAIGIEGPHEVSDCTISAAFEEIRKC